MTGHELCAVAHELGFWKGFVKTDRFLKGWVADIPTPELHKETKDLILAELNRKPNGLVMDVGSGVVSILNGTVPKGSLFPVDPLSPLYELIFDYHQYRIRPPYPYGAEEVGTYFHTGFQVVHISNALDHCQDPFEAMVQMRKVLVPGGLLIVCGFVNESTHMGGAGLHQWDIALEGEQLTIRYGRDGSCLASFMGETAITKKLSIDGRDWLIWTERKPLE